MKAAKIITLAALALGFIQYTTAMTPPHETTQTKSDPVAELKSAQQELSNAQAELKNTPGWNIPKTMKLKNRIKELEKEIQFLNQLVLLHKTIETMGKLPTHQ
jgi:hypothetical protein